ncbi:MAG: deoxyribodipyrimidine photo-lyase [Kiloniellales bacterium]|nr:deoxyribodipyrimidine photo-lyase [Kiloniellales bacterium]
MTSSPTILWFRQDLRLTDNPALAAAVERGAPILPLYILDEESPNARPLGGAARWWLHHSLAALDAGLRARGAALILRRGPAARIVSELAAGHEAGAVFWNRCYEPHTRDRDGGIKSDLKARGIEARSFNGGSLREPWTIETKSGGPFKVYTPFWRTLHATLSLPPARPAPETVAGLDSESDPLESWGLLPTAPDWSGGLAETWRPGEEGAQARLERFLERTGSYGAERDRPDWSGTSRLSPHLHWGEIGPAQVWRAVAARHDADRAEPFLRQLAWREFSTHLLYHWPTLPERSWKESFEDFPWIDDEPGYRAWCRGETGYPIVDAGMRELYATGWMHNRVRMITASFLIKDLLVHWKRGEAWFWDTLVDADMANNSASWQWVAGSGADAAPYFRIFNPVRQGEKFDPEGAYIRRWLPELAALPDAHIHCPWEAPGDVLADASVSLGRSYPRPMVDHAAARKRALAALETIKGR